MTANIINLTVMKIAVFEILENSHHLQFLLPTNVFKTLMWILAYYH